MEMTMPPLTKRLSRLRSTPVLRSLLAETRLTPEELVAPLFIREGLEGRRPISTMPGISQLSVNEAVIEAKELYSLGVKSLLLFGIPGHKDELASDTYSHDGIIQKTLRAIKEAVPEMLLISDVCLCQYTENGHCGVMVKERIDTEATLDLLQKQAISHAEAGADIVAPSGMIDGMIGAMRMALDETGFSHIPILSYAVKYCSSLYGPFREAAGDSKPKFGDRKTYQMDPANGKEAIREARLDIEEGADILMVKPATFYLDVVKELSLTFPEVPIFTYVVGGEYSMIKAAAKEEWIQENRAAIEMHIACKRAGARAILTYFAKDLAKWLA